MTQIAHFLHQVLHMPADKHTSILRHHLKTLLGHWRLISSLWLLYVLVLACAEPSAPGGGPQDTRPPVRHPKRYSTPNGMTDYPYQRVILTFDEWVKLQRPQQQIVISPPLENTPQITVRNKSVVVAWDEPLKDSTTYLIQFGESVVDITENNAAKNLQLVFSTGAYLDSLQCVGEVVRADTREPAADTWVMLYRNLADSVPRTQKPYYFAKTDASGRFKMEYLRGGRYRVFALLERSNDYKYNSPSEEIGFLDTSFVLNDTTQPFLRLLLFQERLDLRVLDADVEGYGQVRISLNQAVNQPLELDWLGEAPAQLKVEQGNDTLRLWYDGGAGDSLSRQLLLYDPATDWRDTVEVRLKSRSQFLTKGQPLRWVLPGSGSGKGATSDQGKKGKNKVVFRPAIDTNAIPQHPLEPLTLEFTQPIEAWDTSFIQWLGDTTVMVLDTQWTPVIDTSTQDTIGFDTTLVEVALDTFFSLALPTLQRDSNHSRRLMLAVDSIAGARYQLRLLPGAVTDFFGRKNVDTLSRIYQINSMEEYGSLTLRLVEADSTQQYIIELVDGKKQVRRVDVRRDSSQHTLVYPYLPKGSYTIRLSTDLNRNGRWDVGNYSEKRQPEPRTIGTPNPLQSGWNNELELNLNPKAKTPSGKTGKKGKLGGQREAPTPPEDGPTQGGKRKLR